MPRRTPYWTLPSFAVLVALPLGWAIAALATIAVAQTALRAVGRAARRRATRRAIRAAGPGLTLGLDPNGEPVRLGDEQLAAHGYWTTCRG